MYNVNNLSLGWIEKGTLEDGLRRAISLFMEDRIERGLYDYL